MIDPTAVSTIRVGELSPEPFSLSDNVPHEVGTELKRGTIEDLATFISAFIGSTDGVGFRAISVADGQTLPTTTQQEFILVGKGTYYNVVGGSTIICTEELNAIVSNGSYWFIGVEIPVNVELAGITQFIRDGFINTTPSEDAVYEALALKANVSDSENIANKQNDLTPDGTGTKYPTVDAVNANVAKIDTSKKLITAQINNVDGNLGQLVSENLAETTTFIDNMYVVYTDGTLAGSGNFRTTGYMSVIGGYKYLYNRKDYGLISTIVGAWYDKNNLYISGIYLGFGNYGMFTAPANAAYARVSYSMGTGVNNDYFYRTYKFSSYGDSITAQNQWQPLLSQYFSLFPVNVGTGGAPLSGSGTGALNNDAKLAGIPSDSDIITILAGTNDWAQSVALGTENSVDVTTFYGALNVAFKKLKVNHPNATIMALATTYGEYPNYFTNPIGILNNLNLSTTDYANAVVIASKNHNIRFVRTDNLWNNKNIANFITFDGAYLHPNAEGGKLMASKISLDIVQDFLKLKAKENKTAITTALTGTSNILPKYDGLGNLVSSGISATTSLLTIPTDASINSLTFGRGSGNGPTNLAIGNFAFASNSSGGNNIAIGGSALFTSTNTSFDVAIGVQSMFSKSLGNGNVALGYKAGRYISDGVTNLTNSLESIYIGYSAYPLANAQSNQIVIGSNAVGNGSNSVTLGNDSITKTVLKGNITTQTTPATSVGTYDILTRNTSTGVIEKVLNNTIATIASPAFNGVPTAPTATTGTNTTQIATTAFVQGIRPYKVYTALLTQVGTNAPTATVLENTLGDTVVWTRTSAGSYVGTLSGAFVTGKTVILYNASSSSFSSFVKLNTSNNTIDWQNGADDRMLNNGTMIEIRVYN